MKEYEVIIVGGGIHGAGVLQAAVAAGHSALLIEKRALASGTSSRSSKLIHGGLRYLESGQFSLVRESLRERAIHLRIAPELVELKSFFIPVYSDTRRRPWQLKVGLALYALLGGFSRGTGFGSIPKRDWSGLDGLETRNLDAVIRYYDAQTDDAALTRAVVESARSLGGEIAMPATFVGASLREEGVEVTFDQDGSRVSCRARVLVNAAGPWATQVARAVTPSIPVPAVDLVQGTHIVLPMHVTSGTRFVLLAFLFGEHLGTSPAALAAEVLGLLVLALGVRILSGSELVTGTPPPPATGPDAAAPAHSRQRG